MTAEPAKPSGTAPTVLLKERSQEESKSVSDTINLRQTLVLAVLSLALAIIVIDATVVSVTLPSILKEFQISVQALEWITSLYALVFGTFLLTWGKLSDEFGRKRIFIGGVVVFVVGSVVTGVSGDLSSMLVGRGLQGFGAAMASPSTLSILTTTFTGKARGVAFGIWASVAGGAAVVGPILGGFFTTYYTWRWAFLINVPIGAIAIIGALLLIKESRVKNPNYSTDYAGVALISLSLSALLFGFIEAQTYGWIVPNEKFALLGFRWPLSNISLPLFSIISGFMLLAVFGLFERKRQGNGKDPLFDIGLLKFPGFRYGIITVSIVSMGEFAVIFFLSLYFQVVRGLSAINSGITFLPLALSLFLTAPLAGLLSNRIGPKWIITLGMILEASAIFSLSQIITVSNPIYYLYPILAIYGVGIGLALGQLVSTVLGSVPWQKAGVASGTNNTVRQIGSAFGVAVIGAVLVAQISAVGTAELAASSIIPNALKASLASAFNSGLAGGVAPPLPQSIIGTPLAAAIVAIFNDAITQGVRWAALTASIFVSMGAVSSLLIPNATSRVKKVEGPVTLGGVGVGRTGLAIISVQFAITVALLAALSSEYMSNRFMQEWFTNNIWPIGFLLNDYVALASFLIFGILAFARKLVFRKATPLTSRS
jgi:EmrB/QacA subfamily drug resistance transporter